MYILLNAIVSEEKINIPIRKLRQDNAEATFRINILRERIESVARCSIAETESLMLSFIVCFGAGTEIL